MVFAKSSFGDWRVRFSSKKGTTYFEFVVKHFGQKHFTECKFLTLLEATHFDKTSQYLRSSSNEPLFLPLNVVARSSLQHGRVGVEGLVRAFVLAGDVNAFLAVEVLADQDGRDEQTDDDD